MFSFYDSRHQRVLLFLIVGNGELKVEWTMPPPQRPRLGPQPPKRKGGLAPRRFNVLSAALASALSVEELTTRMEVIHLEAQARSSIFVEVVANLIAEKIHAAVARHWFSTLASRDYVYAEERKEFRAIAESHRAQLRVLRSSVAPETVGRMMTETADEEQLGRKKIVLLEEKMFTDFFLQLGRMLLLMDPLAIYGPATSSADGSTKREPSPRPFFAAAAQAAEHEDLPYHSGSMSRMHRRRTQVGLDGRPLVHLCEGCPFIKAEDCPFYSSQWISKDSFVDQHIKRKLPRLKNPIRLEQISYEKLLREREEYIAKMNVRLYSTKLVY